MRLYLIFLFVISLIEAVSAQQHDKLWHLGYQGGPPVNEKFGISILDFSDNNLQITSDVETIEMEFFGTRLTMI